MEWLFAIAVVVFAVVVCLGLGSGCIYDISDEELFWLMEEDED